MTLKKSLAQIRSKYLDVSIFWEIRGKHWLFPESCESSVWISQALAVLPVRTQGLSDPRVILMAVHTCGALPWCAVLWVAVLAHSRWPQAPLSMEFSSQDQWSGLPSPTPEDLRKPGLEPVSPAFPALAGRFFTTEPPGKPLNCIADVKDLGTNVLRFFLKVHFHIHNA